jgi:hypothetical protein
MANVANAAGVIAGVGYWYEGPGASSLALAVSLVFWIVETWFAIRVAVDRRLFHAMAEDPEAAATRLDELLVEWKLRKAPKSPTMENRSLADRSRGALRLLRMQWAAMVLQLAVLASAMILRAVNL